MEMRLLRNIDGRLEGSRRFAFYSVAASAFRGVVEIIGKVNTADAIIK